MARAAPPPIRDIVEEHLDEAAFLWTQRLAAVDSAASTVDEVAEGPEERLLAHLDGLRVGGAAAEAELLVPALVGPETDRAAAAAAALALAGRIEPLAAALPAAEANRPAIALALAAFLPRQEEARLLPWLDGGQPAAAGVALGVLAARGAAPPAEVRRALRASDLAVRLAGLRAAAVLGDAARPDVEAALASPDPGMRGAAIEAGLELRLLAAWQACQRAADAGRAGPLDLQVLAMSGTPDDLARLEAAARVPAQRAAALFAAGHSGRVVAADLCARFLDDALVAPVAAEGLRAVAGLAIEGPYRAPPPAEPEEDPEAVLDGPVAGVDRALPWPDPELVQHWWARARSGLAEGARWLEGQPFGPDALLRAFALGPTRRRPPLARELLLRSRGEYRVDLAGLAREQLRRARELRLVARADFGHPLSRLLRP